MVNATWPRYRFPLAFFPKDRSRCLGVCEVEIVAAETGVTVVLTEIPENPGRSVTNALEEIASVVRREYLAPLGLHPEAVRWIEHYTENAVHLETWDEVTFSHYNAESGFYENPKWRHIKSPDGFVAENA